MWKGVPLLIILGYNKDIDIDWDDLLEYKTNFREQSYLFVLKLYLAKSCISGSYTSPNVFIGLSSNSSNKEGCVNIKILERNTTN